MEIVAYRCVWDGDPGWMQYNDKTDPPPDQWDDDEHPDDVSALVLKVDADIEIERLRVALKKANDQAEHFEREWYLRGDALEKHAAWLGQAHVLCSDLGVPPGHIEDRLFEAIGKVRELRE